MLNRGEYLLLITDRWLTPLGDPIIGWKNLDVTLRFNEPGSGRFTAPGEAFLREQLLPGSRVVVIRYQSEHPEEDGQFVFSGPVEDVIYERSDDGENAGIGMIAVTFSDDLAEVVARLTYPDPTLTPETQVTDSWTYSGNAETALRDLVNLNAGPGALPDRQMPGLVLGSVAGAAGVVDVVTGRMEPLGDVLRRVAFDGGGLGFRTRQVASTIAFEVFTPEDKSGSVRFSFGLGNVKYLGYETSAPKATVAIVGGQGEGADRFVLERADAAAAAAWGRRETLVSRPGSGDTAVLQADGDKVLAEAAETARLQTALADTEGQRYGMDYGLGDRVAIESWPGEQLVDIVRTVHLQAWPTAGDVISVMVGSMAASSDPAWIQRLREIDSRVGRLERTVVPAVP